MGSNKPFKLYRVTTFGDDGGRAFEFMASRTNAACRERHDYKQCVEQLFPFPEGLETPGGVCMMGYTLEEAVGVMLIKDNNDRARFLAGESVKGTRGISDVDAVINSLWDIAYPVGLRLLDCFCIPITEWELARLAYMPAPDWRQVQLPLKSIRIVPAEIVQSTVS